MSATALSIPRLSGVIALFAQIAMLLRMFHEKSVCGVRLLGHTKIYPENFREKQGKPRLVSVQISRVPGHSAKPCLPLGRFKSRPRICRALLPRYKFADSLPVKQRASLNFGLAASWIYFPVILMALTCGLFGEICIGHLFKGRLSSGRSFFCI